MNRPESAIDRLLLSARPSTAAGADLLLDLRELLLHKGHPGKCILCFFGLLGNLDSPGALRPLRHWLEQNLEVAVCSNGQELEALPVQLADSVEIEDYCTRTMETLRMDRCYGAAPLELSFRFKVDHPRQAA